MPASVKIFIRIILILAALVFIMQLYFIKSCIATTIAVYGMLFFFIDRLFKQIDAFHWGKSNMRISYWAVFLSLLLAEIVLRYGFKTHLSYSEKNGLLWYTSPYKEIVWENFKRKIFPTQEDARLHVKMPFSYFMENKSEFAYKHSFNSLGIREREFNRTEIDSSYRILGLGDSFTEGVGAPEDSTWMRQLETLYRNSKKNSIGINGGSNGSDVFYEYFKLKNLLYDYYKPQIVILAINSSDINDIIFRGGNERFVSSSEVKYNDAPWWEYLYSFSFIARNIIHTVFNIEWHYYTHEEFAVKKQEALDLLYTCITNQFVPFAEEKKIKLVIVFSPMQYELEENLFPYEKCKNKLTEHNIVVVDLFQSFQQPKRGYNDYFWQTDLHNNSKGYGVWAKTIYEHLIANTPVILK